MTTKPLNEIWKEFNQTAGAYPRESSLHAVFEANVIRNPSAPALKCRDAVFSYEQVNILAGQVAHRLRAAGIGIESRVALMGSRKPELIVAILGILKAGAVYVPIDPAYPRERVEFMLNNSGCEAIFQTSDMTLQHSIKSFLLDDTLLILGGEVLLDSVNIPATNMAYVMYTSGSTGQPRGVMVTHRSVVRLVKDSNYGQFGLNDAFIHAAPIGFDAATFEIWAALLNSSCLVLVPEIRPTLIDIGRAIREGGVNCLCLSTGLFHLFVDERLEDLKTLRFLLIGGDTMSAAHVRRFKAKIPACILINGYGPTECATMAASYTIPDDFDLLQVPIGRPIANTKVYVLDENHELALPSQEGEIYIGGDAVARGYLNEPDKTADRFIPDPFCGDGGMMYRTGDRGYLGEDGNLIFCGRADFQIKLRGFRVELGEIEAAIMKFPGVQDAVAVARAPREHALKIEHYLIAFTVFRKDSNATVEGLKAFLQTHLPAHMLPTRIQILEALPLTPNGKIDRKLLMDPTFYPFTSATENEKPVGELQAVVTQVWSEILGVTKLSSSDNFFDAGGTSLLAVKLQARLAAALKRDVSITDLFVHTTIEAQADHFRASAVRPSPGEYTVADRSAKQRSAFSAFKPVATGRADPK